MSQHRSLMCREPNCDRYANRRVVADGTDHGYEVCGQDVMWAKRQLAQDFPGRGVSVEFDAAPTTGEVVDLDHTVQTVIGDWDTNEF